MTSGFDKLGLLLQVIDSRAASCEGRMPPSHGDPARIQELSEALRRHMLPHLPFPELASLSGTCSG